MRLHPYFLPLIPIVCLVANAQEAPPIEAQKYHDALLKHPHNTTVFSRFYDAWIDAQSIESLEAFLKKRAETHKGIDYIILARYQLRRGQDPYALASINKAIESLPNDPALLLERANLLVRTLDFKNARTDLEAVTKLGNETLSIEANKLIGKSHLREGNPEAAIQAWEKILTNHPKNEDLLEDLVELASSAEQTEQALKYSARLVDASNDPYKKALRLIRQGELLVKLNESDKAIELWSETLSQTGEGSWLEREILAFIEQSYRRLDRIDLLTSKLEELAAAHPRRLLIHRELAKLEAGAGNIDSAIGRFREVLRRSPGEPELREEFIRLLITSERFDDASAEIGKMLASTPRNPELHLRLAELAFQKSQLNPDHDKVVISQEILISLEKAHEYLDPTEASGLRIANLMIRYGLEQNGESLLKELSAKPDASSAPAEALAAEYTRTKRPSKALEILTELTKSTEPETVLRSTNAMAPLTKAEIPFNILLARLPDFPNNNPYIAALIQASLSAKKPADAIPSALKLVRSSKLSTEIQEATKLASTAIHAAGKTQEIIAELSSIEARSNPEICLLAALLEIQKEHAKSDALFANTTEPNLLRFHSSLLSVRGDFKAAIASLNRLAETSADNSASYFKELSDLQLRSGDAAAALKTIEQWKITAPTDKTPWTIATRLLRESGRSKEALETTRRALSRFSNDEDLTATLADLYQEMGDRNEAERILWKLYDQAPDTNSQSRWAARLANLAYKYGKADELKEKFIQRSRSNHQSIGPILALVELARATRDEDSLLEHLYQALRIKPKDIDIRLQIAAAEKQAGNLEKQMTVLNEGIDHDSSGRIRTSLAQAFIDQGQVIKGMHMLRALNGERASDPRFVETAANSIASSGMIAEAIQYLEESLPPDADWRSRFLLADLLQKDGREPEATTILLSLMDEKNEIPGLIPNSNFVDHQQQKKNQEYYFQSLVNLVTQEIYNARNSHRSFGSQQRLLPASTEELRFRSKILLAFMANLGNPSLNEKIASAKIDELSFITDIISCYSENGIDYLELLDKHPTNVELIRMVIQMGRFRHPTTGDYYSAQKTEAIYDKLLEASNLDQILQSQIILAKLQVNPKNDDSWNRFFSLLDNESKVPNSNYRHQIHYQLQNIIAQQRSDIPANHLPKLKEILLKNTSGGGISQQLAIFALLGEIDPWIDALNKQISDQQKQIKAHLNNQNNKNTKPTITLAQYGFYPQLPQIRNLPLTSITVPYLQNITSQKFDQSGSHSQGTFAAKDLIKHLDRFESPILRAWISILADDEKAIRKTLSIKPSEMEINDLAILKVCLDSNAKRYSDACHGLIKLSTSQTLNYHHIHWAKTTFLAIISEIPEDKRSELLPFAREIIDSYIPPTTAKSPSRNDSNLTQLLQISKKLGFQDLVVKLTPPAPTQQQTTQPKPPVPTKTATKGNPVAIISNRSNPNQNRQRPLTPIDRFHKLSNEGKHSAAAREFLNHVQTQKKQGYDLSYILSNVKVTDEVRKEIFSILDPGNHPSLSKRLEFAEICLAFKDSDRALTVLRALAAERPFDNGINLQLAFSLPENEIDAAANLLKKYADSPEFYPILNSNNQRINQARNNSATFHYYSLLARFLEIADPVKFDYRTFNEINSLSYYFLSGSNLINISSLIRSDSTAQNETPEILRHREICRKLLNAMLRHPLLAESGFRYLRATKWMEDPGEIDELARKTLILETQQNTRNRNNSSNLMEYSAAGWICERLKQSKSPNEILTAEFLSSIEKNDPILSSLLKSFSTIKTTKDIADFWNTGAMSEDGYQTSRSIIQTAVLEKISTLPGASDFFISRIKLLSQNEILNSRSSRSGESNHIPFIRAALTSCKNQNESTVKNLCKTIIDVVYGENFDFAFSETNTNSQDYQMLNRANSVIDSIMNRQNLDPVTAIRVFQSFDSLRVPLQNYYWIQNIFQNTGNLNPDDTLKFLDSMGFFKDTDDWQPLAYSSITNHYDQISNGSTFSITRQLLNENITQNLNYRLRTTEFLNLLENRKPKTFGTIVMAAMFANETEVRERIMLKAFEHAAPQLANASPKRLEDFNLLASYLPPDSIGNLPKKLQAKIKETNDKKVSVLLKTIDQQFKQIEAYPNQVPFDLLNNYIVQLAAYDMDKATEIFLRAYTVYKTNIAHYPNRQLNNHQTYFNNLLSSLSSDRKTSPTSAIKFYRAVFESPNGNDFGYTSPRQTTSHLYNLASNLNSRLNSSIPKNNPVFLRPWLIANQVPGEYHNDVLAAMICYTLYQQITIPGIKELTPILAKTEGLSEKTREIIISCSHITNLRNLSPENRISSAQHLSKLLNDPIFNPNSRTQIALSALRTGEILALPDTAKTYSDIFSNISKEDKSMVNTLVIQSIASLTSTDIPSESIPYLKKISEAFWENANSPKSDEHSPIHEDQALALFLFAVKTGDAKNAELLLPKIRAISIGNLHIITNLILNDHFDIADQLLPEESASYFSNEPIYHSQKLLEKLTEFSTKSEKSEHILRLECRLIKMASRNQYGDDLKNKLQERKQQLVSTYFQSPPKSLQARSEIINTLMAGVGLPDPTLEKEISDIASKLDPQKTLFAWFQTYSTETIEGLPEEAPFKIICSAAMIDMLKGDPTLFKSTCDAITKLLQRTSTRDSYKLQPFIRPFIEPAFVATAQAVADHNTKSFPEILPSLQNLIIEISKQPSLSSDLSNSLAMYDFISHWENQPNNVPDLLNKINLSPNHSLSLVFTMPRGSFVFLDYYSSINSKHNLPPYGNKPIELITSILSRESLSKIFVSTYSCLATMESSNLQNEIKELALNPPDSISPSGKILLKYHATVRHTAAYPDKIIAYQALLKDIPNTIQWHNLIVNSKLHLIYAMGRGDVYKLADMQAVFDSIDPKNVPQSNKDFYERTLKELKNAEAKTE